MNLEEKAIERIKLASDISKQRGQTLVVAYSGGKDSDVLLDLAIKADVPILVQHNHTTVDAPETVYHIREVFQRLTEQSIPNGINWPPMLTNVDGRQVRATMWNLIPKKRYPPTRLMRYCCEYFKERKFNDQHILTGVRWGESNARKQRGVHETLSKKKADKIVYFDEDDDRHKLTDICQMKNRIATNPIIDWTTEEVWEYIHKNGIRMNPLYAQGYTRVGCIGCPLARLKIQRRELKQYPKYREAYIRAFDRMIHARKKAGKATAWKDGKEVMRWWTDPEYNPGQLQLLGGLDIGEGE